MSQLSKTSKSFLPWWGKFLLGVLLVAGLLLGFVYTMGQASAARWRRYAAKLRADGAPLVFKEIEAQRAKLPDDQNGALVIDELTARLEDIGLPERKWNLPEGDPAQWVFIFGSTPKADFFKGVTGYAIEPSRDFLADNRDILEALQALRDKPHGRFEIDYAQDPWVIMLPSLTPVRSAGKLVRLETVVKLIDGDIEGAAESIRIGFHIAGTLDEHPTLIGRLVQIAVEAVSVEGIEDAMRVGAWSDGTLEMLGETIDLRLRDDMMRWALLCERAYFVELGDLMATGQTTLGDIMILGSGVGPQIPDVLLPEWIIRENQMRGVEMHTWLVEAGDDLPAMAAAAARVDREAVNLPATQLITQTLMPSLSRAVTLHQRVQAELRCARAALAAERFRLAHGRLPTSLDELVPAYLSAVPLDPFDNKPLRLVETDEGITIYSINNDLMDDWGEVASDSARRGKAPDIGFRLLRPEHRGLLISDEPPPRDDD